MKEQRHSLRNKRRHLAPNASLSDDLELLIQLKRCGRPSLQRQLLEQLRQAIQHGNLPPGRRLPATRPFAVALGISRNIVEAVYDELSIEGYLVRLHGSGTCVSPDISTLPPPCRPIPTATPRWLRQFPTPATGAQPPDHQAISFGPGAADISTLPMSVWRATWRTVATRLPPSVYGPTAGDPDLRAALAAYLRRARGVTYEADEIIITTGASQALDLIAQATLASGDAVAFEEPGYIIARQILQGRNACILPIPVDDDGMRVDALPTGPDAPKLLYLTPSHQYPLGGRLSVARRMALLGWADAHDSLLIEDDYDSEFRFDSAPLPALTGLDTTGRVVYIGTFSKILTPALRVGYLATRQPALLETIARLKTLHDFYAAWPSQQALLTLITEGHLERHIRRMRRRYGEKRALLSDLLAPLAPVARLLGIDAGLHAYLDLQAPLNANEIANAALAHGVIAPSVAQFYHDTPGRQGLVLGYGGLSHEHIAQGARILREVIEAAADESFPRHYH